MIEEQSHPNLGTETHSAESVTDVKCGRLMTYAFFAGLFIYLWLLGTLGQSPMHDYFDEIGIRDAATTFSHFISQPDPWSTFFRVAFLHMEGPLQFMLLNAWAYAVGDILPLSPATMQFPNTLFTFAASVFAYLIGARLYSARFGYMCALLFVLSPWWGETIRVPWVFNTVSTLLHFAIFYFMMSYLLQPESRLYRAAAPACLALYLLTALDWPSFLFALALFVIVSGRFGAVLRNPYNIIPLLIGLIQIAWPIWLFLSGRKDVAHTTVLLYPFVRYSELATNPDFLERVVRNVLLGGGLHLALACAGIALYVLRERTQLSALRIQRSMMDALVIWFLIALCGLVSSSTSATYLYVMALPTTVLAAMSLSRFPKSAIGVLCAVMLVFQVYLTFSKDFTPYDDGDRRVLAAACFLIEQRPDLLREDKTAFLPRNIAAAVGQYARGQNKRVVMPKDFPTDRRKHAIGSPEPILHAFVDAYEKNNELMADWLILDTELFSKDIRSREFYRRIQNDPNVRWIARFADPNRGELYIGEVQKGKGSPVENAPALDTRALSNSYIHKYDRINFLKRNVQYVDHF
ncbi:MAG: hypothetical protein ACOYXY_13260 [Thermodesulfobacteriota bacterium]